MIGKTAAQADGLRVLERPAIPLHTNASENDLRAWVIKRKMSHDNQRPRASDNQACKR